MTRIAVSLLILCLLASFGFVVPSAASGPGARLSQATPTATPIITGENPTCNTQGTITVCGSASYAVVEPNQSFTIYGRIVDNDVPQAGVSMSLRYNSTTPICISTTNAQGMASCFVNAGSTLGEQVAALTFRYLDADYSVEVRLTVSSTGPTPTPTSSPTLSPTEGPSPTPGVPTATSQPTAGQPVLYLAVAARPVPPTATTIPTLIPTATPIPSETPTQGPPTFTPEPSPTSPPSPTSEPTGVYVLGNHTFFIDNINYLNIVGEIKNNSTGYIDLTNITANVYNGGQIVATQDSFTWLGVVAPGEKACFRMSLPAPAAWTHYYFEAPTHYSEPGPRPALSVIQSNGTRNASGSYDLIGEVRNDSGQQVRFAQVIGTLYNAQGQVRGCSFDYTSADPLAPGQQSSFDIFYYGRDYNDIASYVLQVEADRVVQQSMETRK